VAAPIDLPNVDPSVGIKKIKDSIATPEHIYILEEEFFQWLSTTVDVLNQDIDILQNAFNFLITAQSVDIGGGGVGPIAISVPGLTINGYVVVNLLSSSNPVTITAVTPGVNQFTVTFSADPGASAIIKYVAYTAKP